MADQKIALNDDQVFLSWEAQSRPYRPRSKEFYRTALAFVFLVAIILLFIGEFLLIGVIIATSFVVYALSIVPPEKIKNQITKLGIDTGGHFHKWETMFEFWFDEKMGQKMLVIRTVLGFPSHLQLLLHNESEMEVKRLLSERIPYRETPERTFLDRASTWLSEKIPFEKAS